jgi:LAO/AO transport system kinase
VFIRKTPTPRAPYRPSSDLVALVLAGSQSAVARMISRAEAEQDEAADTLARIYRHAGRAHVVGITGVPGGGKSTLIAALIRAFTTADRKVAIVAVDPSSPYSGGAILGDRIRMGHSAAAGGAFIRSMATRGHLGGLSRATFQAVDVLDAAGYSPIFIETVGVGQDEVEIMTAAHTVVVLSPPGLGDDIQAIKAGVMEIADIHAVSKSDRPEAAATVTAIRGMLALGSDHRQSRWETPVLALCATTGVGIDGLKQAIESHRDHLVSTGELATRQQAIARTRILATINNLIRRRFDEGARSLAVQLRAVTDRASDPLTAAERLLGLNQADLS